MFYETITEFVNDSIEFYNKKWKIVDLINRISKQAIENRKENNEFLVFTYIDRIFP